MTGAVSLRRSWNRRLDTTPCVLKQGGISLKKLVENQNNHLKTQVSFQFESGSSSIVDADPYDFGPPRIRILHYLYGSGFFKKQAKKVSKTFIYTIFLVILLFIFEA
jgi:hypothetical protein